jgi:fucose 4-O-acetylase-like acetyltransferase
MPKLLRESRSLAGQSGSLKSRSGCPQVPQVVRLFRFSATRPSSVQVAREIDETHLKRSSVQAFWARQRVGYFARVTSTQAWQFMKQSDKRNIRIDSLRGLACLLLVLYHVVGGTSGSGLNLDRSHALVLFNELLGYLRMPLFSLLSGYVYARRPFRQDASAFVAGKARRLLIPMLVVGTAFALLQAATPGSNSQVADWHMLHILPVAHYWFLQSLFIIFMAILALERFDALVSTPRFAAVFGVAAVMFVAEPLPVFFGLAGAVYLFPFVLFGLWCGRFARNEQLDQGLLLRVAATVLVLASLHAVLVEQALPGNRSLTGLALGCGACLLLLRSGIESTSLASLGRYSFAIFLFHPVGSAASRILLTKAGFTSLYVLVPAGMVVGLASSVWLAQQIKNLPFLARWVLGESAPRRLAAKSVGTAGSPASLMPQAPAQARIQRRLLRVRERMAALEITQSVQSKQGQNTMF